MLYQQCAAVIDQKLLAFRREKLTPNELLEIVQEKQPAHAGRSAGSSKLWVRAGGGAPGGGERPAPGAREVPLSSGFRWPCLPSLRYSGPMAPGCRKLGTLAFRGTE